MSTTASELKNNFGTKLFNAIENPWTLGALFLLGGIVGATLFAPALIVCAICILLGIHRSNVVADQPRKVQLIVFVALAFALSVGGYFLYGVLDSALQKVQIDFAKRVASFVTPPTQIQTSNPQPHIALKYEPNNLPIRIAPGERKR
jgi:hypothetical protein